MSRINQTPRGLQELLGNTAAGINPSELLLEVRPSFDMLPFWYADRIEYTVFTGQFGAVFQQQTIRVPQGEMWIPLSISSESVTAVAGEVVAQSIGVANRDNTRRVDIAMSRTYTATTASESRSVGHVWQSYQPVMAGEFFYSECLIFSAAGARNMNLVVRFIRIKV